MDWHYETLEIYDIYEADIPRIKETNPSGYEQILYTEFLHCCEDKHCALDFSAWKRENGEYVMMNREGMIEELRHFVEGRLETAEICANTEQEVRNCQGIAFGAVRFANAIGILPYEEMIEYWDNYMLDKFNHIAQNAGKGPKVEII